MHCMTSEINYVKHLNIKSVAYSIYLLPRHTTSHFLDKGCQKSKMTGMTLDTEMSKGLNIHFVTSCYLP